MVLTVGMLCILAVLGHGLQATHSAQVPVVKMVTGVPPYLGMMMALGIFWLVTEILLEEEGVPAALHKARPLLNCPALAGRPQ